MQYSGLETKDLSMAATVSGKRCQRMVFPGFGKEWSAILLAGVLPHPQRSESKNATICNTISRGIAGRGGKRRFEAVEADGTDFSLALVVWHIGSGKSYTATYIDK